MLTTPAALHHHAFIVFEHYALILIDVEHGDRAQLRGDTAGLRHCAGIDAVHQRLNDGVVGGIGMIREREAALARAVEGIVAAGRHNPVAPTHGIEVHIHGLTLALVTTASFLVAPEKKNKKGSVFVGYILGPKLDF